MSEKRIKVWVQVFKDRPQLVLQWLDPDTGKRKSKSAETADEKKAENARADLESDLNNGRHKEASRMSWEAFRGAFEAEYLSNLRDGTREHYRYVFDLFERLCVPARLKSINERTVSTFAASMRSMQARGKGRGLAASTVRECLKSLRTALGWAVGQKMMPAVPKFPDVKVSRKKPQPIPAESFERLLDKAPDQHTRAFLLCGWLAGLRLNEAMHLEWEETDAAPWLDLGRDRVILPAGFVKSDADQWLPLDPVLRRTLEDLPRDGVRVFNFVGKRGPLGLTGLSQRVINLARRAGVRLTMHSLRKGFGCRYAGKVPAQVLQKLMRHANIKTTMDYYANIDDAVEAAVLGPKCNTSRNTSGDDGAGCSESIDATPCHD
jgi:integrase